MERPQHFRPDGKRPPAQAHRWMVTAPHGVAARIGGEALEAGGTAADGAVAMAAALAVLYPHMTGIGGDAFFLYHDAASGETVAYNGSGAAAELAAPGFYRARGYDSIPEHGPGSALTVPGAVDAWFALHERFGALDLARLVAPAVALARDGAPIARSVARSLIEERALLDADEGARAAYGSGRPEGPALVQPALARTLDSIGRRGRAWFYEGEGAAALDACCSRVGSPLRAADLAAHRGAWASPIETGYRGVRSLSTPPNSQGLALLIAQSAYEAYARTSRPFDGSAAFVHGAVEASRHAYAVRDRYAVDPGRVPGPLEPLLTPDHGREIAGRIDPGRSGARDDEPLPIDRGSTTYFACVDERGNTASVIQSVYQHFGSRVVVPELGFVLHDRGCWFSLDERSPRALGPGLRPFHTLIANMIVRAGKPWIVYGSMGGYAQPQFGLALSERIVDGEMDPQAAVDAPRWRWVGTAGEGVPDVLVESRLGPACAAGLRARGHRVGVMDEWEESMGHAGAIVIDRDSGVIFGGSDSRSDGAALGL